MGTISEKLTYLNETKTRQKNLINALGGEITNETPFREYEQELIGVLPKVTGEGTNFSLSPTIEAPMKINPKGQCKQETTAYIDVGEWEQGGIDSSTGVNIYNASSARTADYISVKPNVLFNISRGIYNSYMGLRFYDSSKTYLGDQQTSGMITSNMSDGRMPPNVSSMTMTITNTNVAYMRIQDNSNNLSNVYTISTTSPSPSYPSDIQVVTGTQEVKVEGKNLFSCDIELGSIASGNRIDSTTIYRTDDFIKVFPNTDYIFSINGSANRVAVSFYTQNKTWINRDSSAQGTLSSNGKFTTPSNCEYILMRSYTDDFNLWATRKLQLEYGSTATSYSPYTSQSYTLHLGDEELAKIGTYQDKIYYDNGKWYKYKTINKFIINGSESGWNGAGTYTTYRTYYNSTIFRDNGIKTNSLIVSDKYINSDVSIWSNPPAGNLIKMSDSFYITSSITSLSDFRTSLGNSNVLVYYVLSTSTTTEITNDGLLQDLNYIKEHIKSYSDTTNITSSGDLSIVISASAIKQLS